MVKTITEMQADIILNMQLSFKLVLSDSKIYPTTEKNILVVQPELKTKFLELCW